MKGNCLLWAFPGTVSTFPTGMWKSDEKLNLCTPQVRVSGVLREGEMLKLWGAFHSFDRCLSSLVGRCQAPLAPHLPVRGGVCKTASDGIRIQVPRALNQDLQEDQMSARQASTCEGVEDGAWAVAGIGAAGSVCGRVWVIDVDQIPVLKLTFK